MRKVNLTREEKSVEDALLKDEYIDVSKKEFDLIAESLAARKKDAVINIRVNSRDLQHIKQKSRKFGIKYQTYISEILHRVART